MPSRQSYFPWTPEHDQLLRELVRQGLSDPEIAARYRAMGIDRSKASIRLRVVGLGLPKFTERMQWRRAELAEPEGSAPGGDLQPAPLPPPDPIDVERERQTRLKALREEREALTAIAGERSLREHLTASIARVVPQFGPPPTYASPVVDASASRETVVQMFSDWHCGENVSYEATRGFNEYDDAIFKERLDRIVRAHLGIKERLEKGKLYQFERLVVGCNGDFVSGTIHELEKHSDHDNIVWAVHSTGRALAEALRAFAAAYPTVEVFCTSGNHGRLPDARRVQQKEPTRSWDTLVYLFAQEMLRDVPNIKFWIPNSYSVAWDIYRHRFLQTHGHDVKSWNSIPWYGLNRLVGNINALEAGRGKPVHYWLFAHFHNPSSLPHATGESFVNGSLIGANEFALNALGKADRPTQWMLMVHPEHGVTSRWPLYATGGIR
jgi:hypothetical protein